MRRVVASLIGLTGAGMTVAYLPALAALGPVRRALTPLLVARSLSGLGRSDHVALTFDDGPDPASTPAFLDLLAKHGRRATFFLLGGHVAANAGLVAEMAAAGHELAVHGWDHTCTAWKRPGALADELRRARDLIEAVGEQPLRWYRPAYGVLTTETLVAARRAGLDTVLWSAWGRDWEARATGERVAGTVRRQLRPGGTVLLHDTDRTSAPGSWLRTLTATEALLDEWSTAGIDVGPLAEHGITWRSVVFRKGDV